MSEYAGFSKVKLTAPTKSTFDLSHDKRLSTRMGRLTPVLVQECVPSDMFYGSTEMLVRLAPLLAPIYDQIQVFVHFFFIANRLLWEDWEEFITGGRLGVGIDPLTAPIPPYFDLGQRITANPTHWGPSSLADYMGIPNYPFAGDVAADYNGILIDAMPHIAYQLVWWEYYRDRNFVDDADYAFPYASGNVGGGLTALRTRNYKHDYFTSALPFTQRGQSVLIPVDSEVIYMPTTNFMENDGTAFPAATPANFPAGTGGLVNVMTVGGGLPARVENIDSVSNTTTTINDFRSAYALQVWLERNAVAGSRYIESNIAHFGNDRRLKQDARLQRPEYIGGGRIPVKISEVVSTAFSSDGTDIVPLANMGGHGVTYGNTNHFQYFCPEHGFILGIMSIMNPPSYHQGLPRMFHRRSFLDYPWPTFAKLGEQEVKKWELFADAANLDESAGDTPLFGYQSRYADWKYVPNTNHGAFHDTLLFWTLTREFSSSPELGEAFNLFEDSTQNRIFAVNGTEDNFWIYIHNKVTVKRPLPYFGTPNTLGFA